MVAQILAIDAWHRSWPAPGDTSLENSREAKAERDRQTLTLLAVKEAMQRHAASEFEKAIIPLSSDVPPRAVVAHHDDWFTNKLAQALEAYGIEMVARLRNGAEALGVVVAEQPDLLIMQDAMAYLPGEEVLRHAREYAQRTLIAVQVDHSDRATVLHEAGADMAFPRLLPPTDVAADLAALVEAHRNVGS